jgi:3',5'-cyclic AMP phosphodiesterase CpdA
VGHPEAEDGEAVTRRLLATVLVAVLGVVGHSRAQGPDETLRFAVIGDNGTGEGPQYEIGRQMASYRAEFPYDLVLMLGDNLYRQPSPQAYANAFERPYKALLDAGVKFVAVLGNHDAAESVRYPLWNMEGRRYFSFARGPVRFFALDSNILDARQLEWLDKELAGAREPWKIAYFHHPIYSNGRRHGSNVELRVKLEPVLLRHGVQVVFSGHDHLYERLKPQKGIVYFVAGSSGQLRDGVKGNDTSAFAFFEEQAFMLVEVDSLDMRFRAVSRRGEVIDSGVVRRQPST